MSPEDYTQYGAEIPSPYQLKEIPPSVLDYNNSNFFREVYPTKFKKVNQTKLSIEEKVYRVILFCIGESQDLSSIFRIQTTLLTCYLFKISFFMLSL